MRKLTVCFSVLLMGVLFFTAQQKSFAATTQENIDIASKAFDDKDCEKALKYYKLAVEERTDDAILYYNIAQCQSYLGQNKAAAASFEKYLELSPDADDTDEVNGWISDLKKKAGGESVKKKPVSQPDDESDQEDNDAKSKPSSNSTSKPASKTTSNSTSKPASNSASKPATAAKSEDKPAAKGDSGLGIRLGYSAGGGLGLDIGNDYTFGLELRKPKNEKKYTSIRLDYFPGKTETSVPDYWNAGNQIYVPVTIIYGFKLDIIDLTYNYVYKSGKEDKSGKEKAKEGGFYYGGGFGYGYVKASAYTKCVAESNVCDIYHAKSSTYSAQGSGFSYGAFAGYALPSGISLEAGYRYYAITLTLGYKF